MARSGCVIGWERDGAATGQQVMTPVSCKAKISSLEQIIYKLSLNISLTLEEALEVESIIGKIEWE